ncbi:hypothetical protein [Nostoc sp. LPT]|nr:hypothetical protein [Nostoc sp. LPT]
MLIPKLSPYSFLGGVQHLSVDFFETAIAMKFLGAALDLYYKD